ncbi:MAG: DNA internalization-related competence protein ComEC/Rec2, partial [Bacteroidetes bacterium]|nr:DNA internalization-related competence protein ComEC/Rec2 [Bacteroidota bacterium]
AGGGGLFLVWAARPGRAAQRLVTGGVVLLFMAGWLSGFVEQRISASLSDPPPGWVLVSGTVVSVDTGSLRLRTEGRHERIALLTEYGWAPGVLRPGDRLHVLASWSALVPSLNPGALDPLAWARSRGVVAQTGAVRRILRDGGQTPWMDALREKGRARLLRRADRRFARVVTPWIAAMMLGDRSALDPAHHRAFQRSGLAHLLAVSGLHVGILLGAAYGLMASLLARVPLPTRARRALLAVLMLSVGATYGTLLGWPASVSRALGMVFVGGVCRWTGRTGWLERSWMLALLVCLLIFPERLMYDVGARLSFAAVGGLCAVRRLLPRRASAVVRGLMGSLAAGLAAFLATAPILLQVIGWVPFAAVPAGLAGIPLASLFLVLAFVALILPAGHALVALGARAAISALVGWATWAGSPTFPLLRNDTQGWFLLGTLMVAVVMVVLPGFSRSIRWMVPLSVFSAWMFVGRDAPLAWTLLDVGQGEAMVLEWPWGDPLIVDTGPGAASGATVARYLAYRGYEEADLVLSHADRDHRGGWERLMKEISLERSYQAWREAENARPTLLGHRWSSDPGVRVMVLHPPEMGDDNLHSLVLLVVAPGLRILLTGDVDAATEQIIADLWKPLWQGTTLRLLKLAHHGSNTSTDPVLLDGFSPHGAFFSAGKQNAFGHPHPAVLDRLDSASVPTFGTLGAGALQMRWNGADLSILRWTGGRWQAEPSGP